MLTNLKTIRQSRGMTQAEVARACGVTPPAVTQWEAGIASPNLARLLKLAALLGVTTDELTAIEGEVNHAA